MTEPKDKINQIVPTDESDIRYLEQTEHIRLRPKLYFGRLGKHALHLMINGAMEKALDSVFSGQCSHIQATLRPDQSVVLEDNGPGLPVEGHISGPSSLEVILTKVGIGQQGAYYGLLNSYWANVIMVNASSVSLHVEVRRDGYLWEQTYHQGKTQTEVTRVRELAPDEATGTKLTFTPDFAMLHCKEFDFDRIAARFQELACTVKGLRLFLRDERALSAPREVTFYEPRGVEALVERLNEDLNPLHPPLVIEREWERDKEAYYQPWADRIQIALQFVEGHDSFIRGFINTCPANRGTHINGMQAALSQAINEWRREKDRQTRFSLKDTLSGVSVAVNCLCPHFHWDLKTSQLISKQHYSLVFQTMKEALTVFAEEHPEYVAAIVEKCRENQRIRLLGKANREG